MTWTIDGCISMQNLDIVRGGNRIAMLDCENEALSDTDILANARLIAAAPDMLAALEAVLPDLWDSIEYATDHGVNDAWLADALHRLDAARAIVNKAKGN